MLKLKVVVYTFSMVFLQPYSGWVFLGFSRMGRQQNIHLLKISHPYPTMIKLETVITYLKMIERL